MTEKEEQRIKGLWGLPSLPLWVPTHQKITFVDKRLSPWWMLGPPLPLCSNPPASQQVTQIKQAGACIFSFNGEKRVSVPRLARSQLLPAIPAMQLVRLQSLTPRLVQVGTILLLIQNYSPAT